jgi:hypothetical protein
MLVWGEGVRLSYAHVLAINANAGLRNNTDRWQWTVGQKDTSPESSLTMPLVVFGIQLKKLNFQLFDLFLGLIWLKTSISLFLFFYLIYVFLDKLNKFNKLKFTMWK